MQLQRLTNSWRLLKWWKRGGVLFGKAELGYSVHLCWPGSASQLLLKLAPVLLLPPQPQGVLLIFLSSLTLVRRWWCP